jgi:hypothetical protein
MESTDNFTITVKGQFIAVCEHGEKDCVWRVKIDMLNDGTQITVYTAKNWAHTRVFQFVTDLMSRV